MNRRRKALHLLNSGIMALGIISLGGALNSVIQGYVGAAAINGVVGAASLGLWKILDKY